MKRILICGVAGFLGSHPAKELVAEAGCEVIGIDNLSTGRENNLEWIMREANFTLIRCDVASNEERSLELIAKVDQIYHFTKKK
ncbi:GDP-mannose 4,6-dehydratase [Paenibacillus guangzhouensis]|uniref:GDP-mannose 4,6-dehydratase n=1 Tax=Paenibacillus guangzhouensis TaxID=1473112 RepID=UPI0012675936|nr:GDP-mannose 4,6-dehydratase [Paenibacillus guangzhouensis]